MNEQNRFELNRQLYEAACACVFTEIGQLLQAGADPLDSANEAYPDDDLLGTLLMRPRTKGWLQHCRECSKCSMPTAWISGVG